MERLSKVFARISESGCGSRPLAVPTPPTATGDSRRPDRRSSKLQLVDTAGKKAGAETVVDIDHADAAGAAVDHCE